VRRPKGVYGVGEEPDPRFSLANERTFLAWVRSSLALLAAGVVVDALDLPLQRAVQTALATVLQLLALFGAAHAWRVWARTERALRLREPLPAPTLLPFSVGVALVAILVVLGTLLR